ncbi:MAG: FHA domain-containing protein [Magnetococcus sp. DMHC-6]
METEEEEITLTAKNLHPYAEFSADGMQMPPKAQLHSVGSSPSLADGKELRIDLEREPVTIGRSTDNSVCLSAEGVSRSHARIFPQGGKWYIEDLNSTNGVWVNESRITWGALKERDRVRIGVLSFYFIYQKPDNFDKIDLLSGGVATLSLDATGDMGVRAAEVLEMAEQEHQVEMMEPLGFKEKFFGSSWFRYGVMACVGILVAVGVATFYLRTSVLAGERQFYLHRQAVGDFVANYEDLPRRFSNLQLQGQLVFLGDLLTAVGADKAQFPNHVQLRGLLAQLVFYRVERGLELAFREGKLEGVEVMLAEALRETQALQLAGLERVAGADEVEKLLSLAADILVIKRFRQRFPDPSPQAVVKPTLEDLQAFQQVRDRFILSKRDPKNHLVLSVRYPFFERMVSVVDTEDLTLMSQWKDYTR